MKNISILLAVTFQFISAIVLVSCHNGSPVGPVSVLPASDIVLSRDGHLYIMRDEDSLQLAPVIDTTSFIVTNSVICPKLSPDRRLIAFYATKSFTDIGTMLCVVGVDGKNLRTIAVVSLPGQLFSVGLNWSPDGQTIAYSSPRDGTNNANNIYIVKADGTRERKITDDNCYNIRPKWSFDGGLIAFLRIHPFGPAGFAVYNLSNSKMLEVTTHSGSYFWSPNSNWLAYNATPENPSSQNSKDLYLIRVGDSTITQPLELKGGSYSGTNMGIWGGWDPSGNAILIATSNDTGQTIQNAQILLVNSRSGISTPITTLQTPGKATWSKDGSRIFFTKWRPNSVYPDGFDLYVMNSDGNGQKLVIQGIADPDW